jgi:hypothetical protein
MFILCSLALWLTGRKAVKLSLRLRMIGIDGVWAARRRPRKARKFNHKDTKGHEEGEPGRGSLAEFVGAAGAVSKPSGEAWQQSRRSLVLIVPSVVARVDMNILINPEHPAFARVTHGLHKPVYWDRRLFP